MSLERRLPLVMTGMLVLILGVALFATHRTLAAGAEAGARARLTSASAELKANFETAVRTRAAQLRAAASDPAVVALLASPAPGPTPASLDAAPASVRTLVQASAPELPIVLWDTNGQSIARWGRALDAPSERGPAIPPRPPAGIRPGTPWFEPMFLRDSTLNYWAAVQVRDQAGRTLGTLGTLRQVGPARNIANLVGDVTGEQVTMHFHDTTGLNWLSTGGRAGTAPRIDPDTSGGVFADRPGSGRVMLVELPIAGTPWVVTLETPVASVRARAMRTTRLTAIVFLVLALVGGLVTWRLAHTVTRPLRSLAAAADAVALGREPVLATLDRGDELGQLARSFASMSREVGESRLELERRIADAERANRAKSDFLAMMSHELRTPLNAIAGYAQLLEMGIHGPVTPEQRDALQRITRSEAHLLHLIDDVLSFARVDAGHVEFALSETPVAESLAAAAAMTEPQARAKGITVATSCPDASLTVFADPEKLEQVLLNLAANAVKFTPAGGRVELSALAVEKPDETGAELVQIRVSDTGPGVKPGYQALIFEPFVQGDRALNRPNEGVGLGLAISRELTEGMGGRIALESGPGRGATFTVTLSRRAPAASRRE